MPKLTWELIQGAGVSVQVHRSKVPGGWLIYVHHENPDEQYPYAHGGLTFYPDPNHEWGSGSLA
jgi:hypothetical protein